MLKRENYFWSSDEKTKLYVTFYEPDANVRKVAKVIVSHGIGEHIGRYEALAQYLTDNGCVVAGMDDIGHGKSQARSKARMYFGGPGSWQYLVNDLRVLNIMVNEMYPNIPCFMLGFSMGSFVVRTLLAQDLYEAHVDGAIFAGTGSLSKFMANLVNLMINQEVKKCGGDDKVSEKINSLAFGNYNKYFKPCKTEFDWLCEDTKALEEYVSDPLTQKFITPGMFRELIMGMVYTSKEGNIKNLPKDLPILFMTGESDPVGNFGKSISKLVKVYSKYTSSVRSLKYEHTRHDVFHDGSKEKAMKDLLDWIKSQV